MDSFSRNPDRPAHPAPRAPLTSYDSVLYPSALYPQTHPDRLGTTARLFGMEPALVETCRVLELGCGDGLNLIAMAVALRHAHFTGLDLAATPIAQGNDLANRLRLENLSLRQADLLEVPDDLGRFDYIIAHGLYSWVPDVVREKILRICQSSLAEHGIAYISYNAQPGNHMREVVRGLMQFHSSRFPDATERIHQARGIVNFLAGALGDRESKAEGPQALDPQPSTPDSSRGAYRAVLEQERTRLNAYQEAAVFHDDLSPCNRAFYFHEFAANAAQHGLQFLAEADITDMQTDGLPAEAVQFLDQCSADRLACEQYRDFFRGRAFRQSLLCRAERTLHPAPDGSVVFGLYIATTAQPTGQVEPSLLDSPEHALEFKSANNAVIATQHPLAKRGLLALGQAWPRRLSFRELLAAANPASQPVSEEDRLGLARLLLATHAIGFTDLHLWPGSFRASVSERPMASALARLHLERSTTVPTLRHTTVKLEGALLRELLRLLDGIRTREELAAMLVEFAAKNSPADREAITAEISASMDRQLESLCRSALLCG